MESFETQRQLEALRLRVALLHWGACVALLCLLIAIASHYQSNLLANLAVLYYFGAGLFLSRRVLRRLIEWHPVYSTLYNVTSAKLRFFLFWPLSYAFLFVRLGINKIL